MHPGRAYQRWFGRTSVVVAGIALLLAALHPPYGLNIPVCWLKYTTGLPCPGCGLSRSLSCLLHGEFSAAWHYHAFGPLLLPVFAAIVLVGVLLTKTQRRDVEAWIGRHARAANVLYALLVAGFLTYGVARVLIKMAV